MKKIQLVSLLIMVVTIGTLIGYSASKFLFKSSEDIPLATELIIPVPAESMQTPVVQNYYANAEGTVISKTADSFVLEKDGNQLTIFVIAHGGLSLFGIRTDEEGFRESDFDEVQIGDHLIGGVSIIKESGIMGLGDVGIPEKVIAHRFDIFHQNTQ